MSFSRNLCQLHGVVPFLGLHRRALVFYFDGDSFAHRHFQNIDHSNDFMRA